MFPTEHARSQPEGRASKKTGGQPEKDIIASSFDRKRTSSPSDTMMWGNRRNPEIGGKRSGGSWTAGLIKEMAHMEGNKLVADTSDGKKILQEFGPAKHVKGDVFQGHPRKNVPEREKPTPPKDAREWKIFAKPN